MTISEEESFKIFSTLQNLTVFFYHFELQNSTNIVGLRILNDLVEILNLMGDKPSLLAIFGSKKTIYGKKWGVKISKYSC